MKKNSLKKAFSALALTAVAVSATSVSAFAQVPTYEGNLNDANPKPVLTITKEVLKAEGAAGKTVTVELSVDNAQAAYASTGIHIFFDKRLSIAKDPFGDPSVSVGAAGTYLGAPTVEIDNTNVTSSDFTGIFVANGSKDNRGLNGVLYTFDVTLPADAKAGDVYYLDIAYVKANSEDRFLDVDRQNSLMEAWAFTNGIYNEVHKYSGNDAYLTAQPTYDGYIAIEAPVTTTTTVATTTTTRATTTTTAQATTTTTAQATTTAKATTAAAKTTAKATTAAAKTTAKATTAAAKTTAKPTDSPKTGVAGVGVAVAGLAVAVGTAFVLRKKED